MSKLFKKFKKSLEEALAYAEGKITLKSEIIEIPEPLYRDNMVKRNPKNKPENIEYSVSRPQS